MWAPECIVEDDRKNLYAGLRDGEVVVIRPSASGVIGEGEIEVLSAGSVHATSTSVQHSNGVPLGRLYLAAYFSYHEKAIKAV